MNDKVNQDCLATKGMWIIENLKKTSGSKIETDSQFRLMSLANKKYLSLNMKSIHDGYQLSFEDKPTD